VTKPRGEGNKGGKNRWNIRNARVITGGEKTGGDRGGGGGWGGVGGSLFEGEYKCRAGIGGVFF